jgi:uncharacterized alkaline shock family protein YloU
MAEQIRHRVRAEVNTMTGLRVTAVDVEVTELDRRLPHSGAGEINRAGP